MKKLLWIAALALFPASLLGQAAPAIRPGIPPLTVGGAYSNFASEFNPVRLSGTEVYVDWDLNLFHTRIGAEGEARWLRFNQREGSYQDHYLIGPRYTFRYKNFRPYGKFLLGAGELQFNLNQGHGGYFAMAPGGGVDYRLTRHVTLKLVDYEYQFWPTALGGGLPSHGLSPNGFSFGAGYRFF